MTSVNRSEHTYGGLWTMTGKQVLLEAVAVEGELLGAYIHLRVRQTYVNKESHAVESVYTFPLPSDGTLTGFRMECNGRVIEGVVKEREQAFRAYDDAVVAGHGAALLEQDRKNVFTANVGNLLPGELTVIEIEYVQRVALDEGSMRVMIPTLVAPRYIPGGAGTLSPTGHGTVAPTASVPDADRITPPMGYTPYKLTLDLLIDLGREVQLDSVSHKISVHREAHALYRVSFANQEVALDRDIVIEVRGAGTEQLATVCAHKGADGDGYVAISILPDLLQLNKSKHRTEVLFLIDTSGSMEGESIEQAKDALRVCLRHLREGDRFNILAFENSYTAFSKTNAVFNQQMLERADRWVANLRASGGTELLAPMTFAAQSVSDGVIVLLTDGQVGNEQQILQSVLAAMQGKRSSRVYSFGIGTNVSDQLLRDLARETHGAVEFIHPGERIENKVVAQFARAIAPRVDGLSVKFVGVDVAEIAPGELPPLIDAEPWTLFGRYEKGGRGSMTLSGRAGGEEFAVEVPLNLPDRSEKPAIAKLWATERIRDFSSAKLQGRRAESMKARIIELSVSHGVASQYTSFVVVEKRSGDRRSQGGAPETRVVAVNAPADWAAIGGEEPDLESDESIVYASRSIAMGKLKGGTANPANKRTAPPPPMSPSPMAAPRGAFRSSAAPSAPSIRGAQGVAPPSPPAMKAYDSMSPAPQSIGYSQHESHEDDLDMDEAMLDEGIAFGGGGASAAAPMEAEPTEQDAKPSFLERAKAFIGGRKKPSPSDSPLRDSTLRDAAKEQAEVSANDALSRSDQRRDGAIEVSLSPQELISLQLASGLWDESTDLNAVRISAKQLWLLVQAGVTTGHPMFGTPVKKAIDALLVRIASLGDTQPELTSFALAVAWLAATGRRTRGEIEALASTHPALKGVLGDDTRVRAFATTAFAASK